MTTPFLTLAILLLSLAGVFLFIGSKIAFKAEFEKADKLMSPGCLDTEANYRKAKRSIELITRLPFRNRRKTDELLLLFYDKFKCSMYIDFQLDQANFYRRMVKLTA